MLLQLPLFLTPGWAPQWLIEWAEVNMEATLFFFVVTLVFFYRPTLIHRRKRFRSPVFETRTIAHRGGRETTPENTIAAFVNGAQLSDMVELDVWLTAGRRARRREERVLYMLREGG